LSVGDWSAKIWSEDVKSPMISTVYSNTYLTDGCWSTSRPSVFYTSKIDGSIDVWDYALKQNDPALTVQVSTSPLQCIKIHDRGHMLAVTARDGSTTLLELSESLSKMHNNEKNVYSQFLERESRREKNLESIAREKRIKATQAKRPNSGDHNAGMVAELFKDVESKFFEKFAAVQLE
jgi:dynein intermediate chain 2